MKELISILITHYEAVLQSSSESLFYKNVHSYIDLIVKTPEFAEIIDKSAEEYSKKHSEIWGNKKCATDEEADIKEEKTHRLEQFSLYARDFSFLHTRVYLFIEEYKNNTEIDDRPYPEAMVMLRGVDNISTNLWSKKTLDMCDKRYTNKRKIYEDRLKQFHLDLLIEVEKIKKEEPVKKKLQIIFNKNTGILKMGEKEIILSLRNDKNNSHYILEYIFENKEGLSAKSYYSEVIESKFPGEKKTWRTIWRSCEDINKKVGEQADINNFLIIKSGTTGYAKINSDYLMD